MEPVGASELLQQLERVATEDPLRDLQRFLQDPESELLGRQQAQDVPDAGLPRLHLRVMEPAQLLERIPGVLPGHLGVVDDAQVNQPEQVVLCLEQQDRGLPELPETLK